jgi:hypothetical protein
MACGAPFATAAAYSPPRSRLTTRISGCFFIQAAALSWSRSGNRSTTRWLSRFDFDGPEPVTAPKREIVYSKLDDRACWKIGQIHHPPQDRLARGRHAEPCAEPCSKVAASRSSNGLQSRTRSRCQTGPWRNFGWQTLCKDLALTLGIPTKKFAHGEDQLDLAPTTRDIAQHTSVVAMNG